MVEGETLATLVVWGQPAVLKNSKFAALVNGIPMVLTSKAAKKYLRKATAALRSQWIGKFPIDQPMSLAIVTFGAWRSDNEKLPDQSNLYQAPEDALEKAGVIWNDRLVQNHDGSARICLCDICHMRTIITRGKNKGQRKENCGMVKKCPYARVEITIRKATVRNAYADDFKEMP